MCLLSHQNVVGKTLVRCAAEGVEWATETLRGLKLQSHPPSYIFAAEYHRQNLDAS
jgi:hypothetical protein